MSNRETNGIQTELGVMSALFVISVWIMLTGLGTDWPGTQFNLFIGGGAALLTGLRAWKLKRLLERTPEEDSRGTGDKPGK